jgi:hypothetical protein
MTNEELIATARRWNDRIGNPFDRGSLSSSDLNAAVTAIESALTALEAALPVTVETVEELEALPPFAVLSNGFTRRWPGEPAGLEWAYPGTPMGYSASEIRLPVIVLYTPTPSGATS